MTRTRLAMIVMFAATLALHGQEIEERPEPKVGLFADAEILGMNYWSSGLGIGIIDNAVRIQLNVGSAPEGRFGGLTLSSKMLADIYVIEYGQIFGPRLDLLSSALALGASATYFSMTNDTAHAVGDGTILGAAVVHLDLVRFSVADWVIFNTYSIYTEGLLVYIASDIEDGIVFKMSFGIRTEVF